MNDVLVPGGGVLVPGVLVPGVLSMGWSVSRMVNLLLFA